MEFNLTELIIGIVGIIISGILGLLAKSKGDKLNTTKELIAEISEALKDNQITKEEMQDIFDVIKKY